MSEREAIPRCVNPNHLYVADVAENNADCRRKGRAVHLRGEQNGRAKLTCAAVTEIRRLLAEKTATKAELARRFGVSHSSVRWVERGVTW